MVRINRPSLIIFLHLFSDSFIHMLSPSLAAARAHKCPLFSLEIDEHVMHLLANAQRYLSVLPGERRANYPKARPGGGR